MNKGKRAFSIIIGILIVIILGIVGFLAYYFITNYLVLKEAEEAVDSFEEIVEELPKENVIENTVVEPQNNQTVTTTQNKTTTSGTRRTTSSYRGYNMIGTIQIPKTKVKAPVVDKVTVKSISAAVGILYGLGLNEVGNTVLVAHNYRNGTFFSNNKKLVIGDKIYITDATGRKIEYNVYNTYTTSDMDFSYATRDTNGKREISLSTCTTDASKRLVIWAREN